jgi:hypothetical protein
MNQIKLEILEYSYWEHFKYAKDISMVLPVNNPKRLRVEEELNKMIKLIHEIKNNN